MVELENLTGS